MSLASMKKEIQELKNSIIWEHEPAHHVFILGAKDSPTAEEIDAYRTAHSHTRVVILYRRDCGEGSMD